MTLFKNVLFGLTASALVSVLFLLGVFSALEDRLYDYFFRFRKDRPRIDSAVFLDVDDNAIAYNGMYPWPRSVPADGLLRLKEHGVRAAIFDIEYIDPGPQGVDSIYLKQGLPYDFQLAFSGIESAARAVFSSLKEGRISRADLEFYSGELSKYILSEQDSLFNKAQGVARDNDRYLAQALALFGGSWITLNLRESPLEDEEQASRRTLAQERFSYPLAASEDANRGSNTADILPALPVFANAVRGAGFTNVEIDNDGIRRRIYLAQNVHDHWYLQLAFAPLINYLGEPDIVLKKRKLIVKQAQMPDGRKKDIVIPLDAKGRMLLDWPKTDYKDTLPPHVSFAQISRLDNIEVEIEQYANALLNAGIPYFAQFDPSLGRVPVLLGNMAELFDAARERKAYALENCSDDAFSAFLEYRNQSYEKLAEISALDLDVKVQMLASRLSAEYPENSGGILDEAEYIAYVVNTLMVDMESRREIRAVIDETLRDKFCIIGRVDTGTTDYGANPFYSKYVNVGTHGVVLDTVLSESFIVSLSKLWHVLFVMAFVPLFMLASASLAPVFRAGAGFGVTILVVTGSALLFRLTGVFLGPLGAVFATLAAVIVREIYAYAGSEKEKSFIRNAFSTYVSGDVVKEIINDPSRLQLGGTKRRITALFTDVKGFSTISEKLDPEELVSLLNRYLSAMSDVVLAEKGTIDKYEGDAIIAFFGAPLDLADHALRACISAITMKKIEAELNKTIMERKLSPSPLLTRIGINTGDMVAGNMGTHNKMNYTIMGNAVNLAARLEGVNKQYGTWILASEDTVRDTGNSLLAKKLDRVRVVGINEPVGIYELVNLADNASPDEKKLVEVFHGALDSFERRNWKQAAEGFREALSVKKEDAPSKIYLDRSEKFMRRPPEDSWDGVYNLTEK
jgi:adenylate cyclase